MTPPFVLGATPTRGGRIKVISEFAKPFRLPDNAFVHR